MTTSDIKAMQEEDDALIQMMGKGDRMATLSNWEIVPDKKSEVKLGECPEDLVAKRDWRVKLPKSAIYGMTFGLLFFFCWACWMNGDMSSRLGIPLMVAFGMAATSALTLVWVKK